MPHRATATLALLLLSATAAYAHVSIRPRDAHVGATETYTMRVPTEGKVATTSVHQRYADGTSSDWVDPAGSRRPAPVTKLIPAQ